MNDLRTSLLAVLLWAAALLCIHLPVIALPLAGACGTAAALVVVALRVTRAGGLRVNGLVVLILLCCCAVGLSVAAAQPQRAVLGESDGRAVEVIATVSSSASIGSDGRLWFDAQTIRVGAPGGMEPISASVRIGVDPVDGVDLGAVLTLIGQAKGTEPSEQAGLVIFATDAEVVSPASGIFAIAASTRAEFADRATRLPEPGAGLLPGLAVGDTRAVSEQLNAAMLASGLSHLTAVSGLTDKLGDESFTLTPPGMSTLLSPDNTSTPDPPFSADIECIGTPWGRHSRAFELCTWLFAPARCLLLRALAAAQTPLA